MNVKERLIETAISTVIKSCSIDEYVNVKSVTKDDILGKSRIQLVVIARCILVRVLIKIGFSVTTVAQILHRTKNTVRNLLQVGEQYMKMSSVFKIVYEDAYKACSNIKDK